MTTAVAQEWVLPLLPDAGWFILHFLWAGSAVWLAAALARATLATATSEIRYLVATASLAALVATAAAAAVLAAVWGPVALPPFAGGFWPAGARDIFSAVSPALWCAGTFAFSTVMVAGLWGTRRYRRGNRLLAGGPLVEAVGRWAKTLRIPQPVGVCICRRVRWPIMTGIARPLIVLPPEAASWPAAEAELILLHELAHVRRYDNLIALMQRSIEALLWFHPAVWSVSRWMVQERENCCDDCVLTLTGRQEAYAEVLIRLAGEGRVSPALSSAFGRDPIAARLRRILFQEERTMTRSLCWNLLGVAAVCLCFALHGPPAPGYESPTAAAVASEAERAANAPASVPADDFPAPAPALVPEPTIAQPTGALPLPAEFQRTQLGGLANRKRSWGPEQATGQPDTPEAGDQVTAWASLAADGTQEWLICHYPSAVTARAIAVHETYNPGALYKITAFNADGEEVDAWEGEDPTPRDKPKGISLIPVKLGFPVQRIKLYLDSATVPGWNEIDAVGLEDAAGNTQWAVQVEASTTYAQPEVPVAVEPVGKPSWSPQQAEGEPDTLEAGDQVTAWASASSDGQEEWLLCEFEAVQQPAEIVVHETYNPGAIFKITVFDEAGTETIVWEGQDPTPRDQPLGISVFPVEFEKPARRIKLYIDSVGVPGWNEIDAVGLRDVAGETQWSSRVEASSSYGAATATIVEPPPMVLVDAQQLLLLQQQVQQLQEQVNELSKLREEINELKALLKEQAQP
jgi:beta-lactamase regulating signal transducer with metallopeptidase domain